MPQAMIYQGHSDNVFAVAWSPDGQYIASGSKDTTVHIWHAATAKPEYVFRGHTHCLLSVAWSPDGQRIASGCTSGLVLVWNAFTGEEIVAYHGHTRFVRSLSWSPDGRYIVSGGDFGDSTIQVWNAVTGQASYTRSQQYRNFAVSWSPDGSRIASGNFDGTAQVWDAANGVLSWSIMDTMALSTR